MVFRPEEHNDEYSFTVVTTNALQESKSLAEIIGGIVTEMDLFSRPVHLRNILHSWHASFGTTWDSGTIYEVNVNPDVNDHIVVEYDPPYRPLMLSVKRQLAEAVEIRPRTMADGRFPHGSLA